VALIEQISQDVVSVPAEWPVNDAYGRLSGKAFFVEPFSARTPIADFLLTGGLGWGSLRYGSFASKLYKVQTDKFTFGSNNSTSVNAGYPLHRLVEGMPHELCPYPQAKIERVTVPVRPKPAVKTVFRACAIADAVVPAPAANFIWVNKVAASTLGVSDAGSIAFFEEYDPEGEGEPVEGVYDKRFFEDAVPQGLSVLKVLTVKSNLEKLEELAKKKGRFFIAVWTHLGVLVCISGEKNALAEIEREAVKLPMTFGLPKKEGGLRQYTTVSAPVEVPAIEEKKEEAKPAPTPAKQEKPAEPAPKEPEKPQVKEQEKPVEAEAKKEEPEKPQEKEEEKPAPEVDAEKPVEDKERPEEN
jgi:hypothetical protein